MRLALLFTLHSCFILCFVLFWFLFFGPFFSILSFLLWNSWWLVEELLMLLRIFLIVRMEISQLLCKMSSPASSLIISGLWTHEAVPNRVRVAVRLRPRNAEELVADVDFADCVEIQPEVCLGSFL